MKESALEQAKQLHHQVKVLQSAVDTLENSDSRLWPTVRILYEDGYDHYIDGMDQLLKDFCAEMLRRAKKKLVEVQRQFEELK